MKKLKKYKTKGALYDIGSKTFVTLQKVCFNCDTMTLCLELHQDKNKKNNNKKRNSSIEGNKTIDQGKSMLKSY